MHDASVENDRAERAAALLAAPIEQYLVAVANGEVADCTRPVTGAQLAAALRLLSSPPDLLRHTSYDGRGGISLGQFEPGVDRVLRTDGTLDRVRRKRMKSSRVRDPNYEYVGAEVVEMLRAGQSYLRAIARDNR